MSTALLANAGLPMLAILWPASLALFIPIVLVEGLAASRIIQVRYPRALAIAGVTNLASTVLAVPLTWVFMVVVQIVAGQSGISTPLLSSAWIPPLPMGPNPWFVPRAAIILCVPFFFASVAAEYLTARLFWREFDKNRMRRWAWIANAISYAGIVILLLVIGMTNSARTP